MDYQIKKVLAQIDTIMENDQIQLIKGTLLGKSYLSKPKLGVNYFLTMPDIENPQWLNFKVAMLQEHSRNIPFYLERGKRKWRSTTDEMWTELYDSFYKKITMDSLNSLRPLSLAVWFLDKGFFATKKKVCLRTTSFGMRGNRIIARFFNEVDMPCKIKKERDTGKIMFTEKGTYNFLKCIASHIPPFMVYRLEEREQVYDQLRQACSELYSSSYDELDDFSHV